jgi:hypothetical protein
MAQDAHSGVGPADDGGGLRDGQSGDHSEGDDLGLIGAKVAQQGDRGPDRRLAGDHVAHVGEDGRVDAFQFDDLGSPLAAPPCVDGAPVGDRKEPCSEFGLAALKRVEAAYDRQPHLRGQILPTIWRHDAQPPQ